MRLKGGKLLIDLTSLGDLNLINEEEFSAQIDLLPAFQNVIAGITNDNYNELSNIFYGKELCIKVLYEGEYITLSLNPIDFIGGSDNANYKFTFSNKNFAFYIQISDVPDNLFGVIYREQD